MSRYNKVLLIDDNEIDNFTHRKLILKENFASEVIEKESGQDALDFLKSADRSKLPDIIFLDIMMPVMDGFNFLDEYDKLDEGIRETCKIIMLSSTESFKDLNRANKNIYVIKFLNKPLTEAVLAAINV